MHRKTSVPNMHDQNYVPNLSLQSFSWFFSDLGQGWGCDFKKNRLLCSRVRVGRKLQFFNTKKHVNLDEEISPITRSIEKGLRNCRYFIEDSEDKNEVGGAKEEFRKKINQRTSSSYGQSESWASHVLNNSGQYRAIHQKKRIFSLSKQTKSLKSWSGPLGETYV